MAPSLEVPVPLEVEDGVLVAEEGMVWGGALEGADIGEFADLGAEVLRMIRALGGMVMAWVT
jgi:hypothetical protein